MEKLDPSTIRVITDKEGFRRYGMASEDKDYVQPARLKKRNGRPPLPVAQRSPRSSYMLRLNPIHMDAAARCAAAQGLQRNELIERAIASFTNMGPQNAE